MLKNIAFTITLLLVMVVIISVQWAREWLWVKIEYLEMQ